MMGADAEAMVAPTVVGAEPVITAAMRALMTTAASDVATAMMAGMAGRAVAATDIDAVAEIAEAAKTARIGAAGVDAARAGAAASRARIGIAAAIGASVAHHLLEQGDDQDDEPVEVRSSGWEGIAHAAATAIATLAVAWRADPGGAEIGSKTEAGSVDVSHVLFLSK